MGELTVSNGSKRFTASPQFNNRIGMPLYETPDDWDSQALFVPGDNLEIAATGGGAIGAFDDADRPALLNGVDEVALDTFVGQARALEAVPTQHSNGQHRMSPDALSIYFWVVADSRFEKQSAIKPSNTSRCPLDSQTMAMLRSHSAYWVGLCPLRRIGLF